MKQQTQTFNDGVLTIYKVTNIAAAGRMPKDGLSSKKGPLRYDERIVGMGRYWTAKQENVKVDRLIRVPLFREVSTQDVVIPNDGEQYSIKQIQYPKDVVPPCMDLSLERLEAAYDIEQPDE